MIVLCNFKEEEVQIPYSTDWKEYELVLGNYEEGEAQKKAEENLKEAKENSGMLKLRASFSFSQCTDVDFAV